MDVDKSTHWAVWMDRQGWRWHNPQANPISHFRSKVISYQTTLISHYQKQIELSKVGVTSSICSIRLFDSFSEVSEHYLPDVYHAIIWQELNVV